MTEEQIAEIRARAEAATPGPWWTGAKYSEEEAGVSVIAARTDCGAMPGNPTRGQVAWATKLLPEYAQQCEADAVFIAHAREDIPAILSALEAANKRADEADARRKCYECGSEMTACAQCNPELVSADLTALRARVAELKKEIARTRGAFYVEYGEDGSVEAVAHDSGALRTIVSRLDAALKEKNDEQG